MNIPRLCFLFGSVGILLTVLKYIGVGNLPAISWWEILTPTFVVLGAYILHIISKAIIAYSTLVTIVQVLYDDYQQRNAPMLPMNFDEGAVNNGSEESI